MSGLNLNSGDVEFLTYGETNKSYHIRLEFIDKNCKLLKNVCLKGISLKNWAEARIYQNNKPHDAIKGQGFYMFNWPQLHEGDIITVETKPETDWSLIVALEVPMREKKGNKLVFWEPLENIRAHVKPEV